MPDVSPFRLNLLRLFYLVAFLGGCLNFWPRLFYPDHTLGVYDGAAFSFWAALMALFGVGIRYPLEMVPLVILQLFYKLLWLIAVALPLRASGLWDANATRSTRIFLVIIAVDLIVIPWRYVITHYVPGMATASARRAAPEPR